MPSELPQPAKPLKVSGLELEGQEPTIGKGEVTILDLATIGDSTARISTPQALRGEGQD